MPAKKMSKIFHVCCIIFNDEELVWFQLLRIVLLEERNCINFM